MEDMPSQSESAIDYQYNQMEAKQMGSLGGSYRNPPVRKVVEARIAELEKQVQAHKDLLKSLDDNPGVEVVLDKLRKVGI